MATIRVAFRYRDVSSSVDTIKAHRDTIEQHGKVLWGWWKKQFETPDNSTLNKIDFAADVLLVDRYARRCFKSRVSRWSTKQPTDSEKKYVPDYYREYRKLVYGWLEITEISEVDYDDAVADQFGDSTFVNLTKAQDSRELQGSKRRGLGNSLLHLSDLHFGSHYEFALSGEARAVGNGKLTLTTSILKDLNRIGKVPDISAILVTGDIISQGDWSDTLRKRALKELTELREALNLNPDVLHFIPGNHDVVRYPDGKKVDVAELAIQNQMNYQHEREYRTFVDEATGRSWKDPLQHVTVLHFRDVDVVLCQLNSCVIVPTDWTEYGFVGDMGIEVINSVTDIKTSRPHYRVLAIHHHLLPVSDVSAPQSKGVTMAIDAARILDAALESGIQLALHGHEHMPRISRYGRVPLRNEGKDGQLTIISNGSTGVSSDRRPGEERNTYGVIDFGGDGIKLYLRELRSDGRQGDVLYEGALGVEPLV